MNEKYGMTLRTPRPYYTTLIWETLDKLRIRFNRLNDIEESIEEVYFDYVGIKKTKLPQEFIMSNFL